MYARELQKALSYKRWDKFLNIVDKAKKLAKAVVMMFLTIFPVWEKW